LRPFKTDGKYLVEDHEISLLPSLYLIDVAKTYAQRTPSQNILILADPETGPDMQALP